MSELRLSELRLSDQAVEELARARRWAKLGGIVSLLPPPVVALWVLAPWARGGGTLSASSVATILSTVAAPAIAGAYALSYARHLRRFSEGQPGALATAFRRLRGLCALGAFALLLLVFQLLAGLTE